MNIQPATSKIEFSKLFFLIGLILITIEARSQITFTTTTSFSNAVNNHFKEAGDVISNVNYSGLYYSFKEFSEPSGELEIYSGILISTGNTEDALKAYFEVADSEVSGLTNESLLTALTPGTDTRDVQLLRFDIVPVSQKIIFEYVFASEEYIESVGTNFNDRMGIFASGPGIIGDSNIALVNGDYVSINTIHPTSTTNGIFMPQNESYYKTNNSWIMAFDGYTKKLYAVLDVIPGQTYTFKVIIGDSEDSRFDSCVFIKRCFGSCWVTGLEEQESVQFSISPNPSNGNIRVNLSNHPEGQLELIDLTGRIISHLDVYSTKNGYPIENIPSGVYTLSFKCDGGVISERIIVE